MCLLGAQGPGKPAALIVGPVCPLQNHALFPVLSVVVGTAPGR